MTEQWDQNWTEDQHQAGGNRGVRRAECCLCESPEIPGAHVEDNVEDVTKRLRKCCT